MENIFIKRVSHKRSYITIVIAILIAITAMIGPKLVHELDRLINPAEAQTISTQSRQPKKTTIAEKIANAIEPDNGQVMHVTGFSSVECHTTWCKANAGKPRGLQVALNKAKFGSGWTKVYIPAYDKTYSVIGNTDLNTDVDIWFGDDHDTALTINTNVMVYLIK